MPDYLMRVTHAYQSGLPSDVAVNDFSMSKATAAVAADLIPFRDFYVDVPTGEALSPHELMSICVSTTGNPHKVEAYDRAAAPGSPPVLVTFFGKVASVSANSLVEEACIVNSFHADLTGGGANLARRRGRIFFGPLGEVVRDTDGNDRTVVDAGARDILVAASQDLLAAVAVLGCQWDVWSTVDGVGREVVGGWVDDAFDTLRSRGPEATTRTAW